MIARLRRPVPAAIAGALAMALVLAGAALAANTIRSFDIVDGSVATADLRNGDVRSIDLRNLDVRSVDIAPGAVTNTKLGGSSVGSGKLADGSVASIDIADGAVGTADLADGAVTVGKLAPVEGWHVVGAANEPAFENGWAAYTSNTVSFRKDRDGMVHLVGIASRGACGSVSTIFTLPAGYRPSTFHGFAISSSSNPFGSTDPGGRISISPTGTVQISDDAACVLVFLGHISFPAA